jgi:hypothetical protein
MLLPPYYHRRIVAIERWSFGTVVATSVTAFATAAALWWVFGDAIAAGTGDRIVVATIAAAAIAVGVPLRWLIARRVDGEAP